MQQTGLIHPPSGRLLSTPIWGYSDERGPTWPGRTFEVKRAHLTGMPWTEVRWANELFVRSHLLPVDTNLHWCYSLHGDSSANGVDYSQYSIRKDGVPIITHLHGGHSEFQFDGNPEFFYSPGGRVTGPQWDFVTGGFTNLFRYDNDVPAGTLWYHDHALGITRLNVYAGLAGFYFVRDEWDTGEPDNALGLPAFPYELAYAIQDRMFTNRGELFYPAYPRDPLYEEFITDEGAILPRTLFHGGGPTALAEFFGDHMVVNGVIWPKADVEPRHYRLRLLNGTDSRFLVIRFRAVSLAATGLDGAGSPIPFHIIGSDQGLASGASWTDTLVFEPGSRYDLVFDFSGLNGRRIIMENGGSSWRTSAATRRSGAPLATRSNRRTCSHTARRIASWRSMSRTHSIPPCPTGSMRQRSEARTVNRRPRSLAFAVSRSLKGKTSSAGCSRCWGPLPTIWGPQPLTPGFSQPLRTRT
jgi:FtsP/CotA-like multicopper oxidase with cupredoxin domain